MRERVSAGADPGVLDGGFAHAKCAENFCSLRPFYLSFLHA